MITFKWFGILSLVPLPILVHYLLPATSTAHMAALRVPFIRDFNVAETTATQTDRLSLVFWLAGLAWVLFIIAASRPQWLGDSIELPVSGRDLMMAVDLSGSMDTQDFEINGTIVDRLTATKSVASRFIDGRVGDRLGLILFGKQAYLQTPLTFDRETVRTLLGEAVIGLAGKETAIGDAIGLAVKRFKDSKDQQASTQHQTTAGQARQSDSKTRGSKQVLILLTDGANTAGEVEPVKAAELAATEGLKIYTIGVGADEMVVRSLFGARRVNPSTDLDEDTLKAIASKTGGKYFRARDSAELQKIYGLLDQLEPVEHDSQSFRPSRSLYPWPLGASLLIAFLLVLRNTGLTATMKFNQGH